jgi:ribosomal protein S2
MTQINYLRNFKDGKWSEGYTEVNDPVVSRYWLPFTLANIKKVEEYLKEFNFKKADELYNRLSKYPSKAYLNLRKKYLRKKKIKEILDTKKDL